MNSRLNGQIEHLHFKLNENEVCVYKMQAESEEQCLRPMNCQLNVLSRSDGSAMFTQGSIP